MPKQKEDEAKDTSLPEEGLSLLKQYIKSAEASLTSANKVLTDLGAGEIEFTDDIKERAKSLATTDVPDGKIVEGVFDGQNMIGPDGKQYPVPANYASKSKLVEGDILKLTIAEDGSFIFKQIGPVDRKKAIGKVSKGDTGEYQIKVGSKIYKVLMASLTYFRAEPGDEVTAIIPKSRNAKWAAIENVIKKTGNLAEDEDIDDFDNEDEEEEENDDEILV
ncbi:MAG: hypothetical protein ABIE68_02410 [bacterium]